jgi:hypothetical protein
MQPGLGYKFMVNAPDTLKYPNSTVFKSIKIPDYTSPPAGWENNLSQFSGNMSVVAKLNLPEIQGLAINQTMVLGAFIENSCRGYVAPLLNSNIGYEPFFLNISNNVNGQKISFKLYDGNTAKTYRVIEELNYVNDAVVGTTNLPQVLTLEEITTGAGDLYFNRFINAYPNPFNNEITIEFEGLGSAVKLDIISATGALVKNVFNAYPANSTNHVIWNGTNQKGTAVEAGMYYIRCISGNRAETIKISKNR